MNDHVRVWCLRHAESENVTTGVAGVVPAMPLTRRGHDLALQAARVLADEPITAIYTSTALRTQQTAAPLAAAHVVTVTILPQLAEVGIGQHEGASAPE